MDKAGNAKARSRQKATQARCIWESVRIGRLNSEGVAGRTLSELQRTHRDTKPVCKISLVVLRRNHSVFSFRLTLCDVLLWAFSFALTTRRGVVSRRSPL